MKRYIAKTVLSLAAILTFNSAVYANNSADTCDLKEIQKADKNVKDLICDNELGNFYLKYSPSKRRIWIENRKNGMKLVLDSFAEGENPEILRIDKHIKFMPKVIRQNGKIFIGATCAHRSRGNDGMGACGSGEEMYFAAIEIFKHSLVKRKQFLLESCLESYGLYDSENEAMIDFLGVLDGNEVVFNWYSFKGFERGATGRFNFLSNELKMTEHPDSECEPKLIEQPESEKK